MDFSPSHQFPPVTFKDFLFRKEGFFFFPAVHTLHILPSQNILLVYFFNLTYITQNCSKNN